MLNDFNHAPDYNSEGSFCCFFANLLRHLLQTERDGTRENLVKIKVEIIIMPNMNTSHMTTRCENLL